MECKWPQQKQQQQQQLPIRQTKLVPDNVFIIGLAPIERLLSQTLLNKLQFEYICKNRSRSTLAYSVWTQITFVIFVLYAGNTI